MAADLDAAILIQDKFQSLRSRVCTACEGLRWKSVPPGTRNNTPLMESYWDAMSWTGFPENYILLDS